MCRAFDREDLIEDGRFATARARGLNGNERKQIMADEIAKWSRSEILDRLRSNEVPSAPLLKRTELLDNDQVLAGGSVFRQEYDGFGEVRQAAPAARFSKTPSEVVGPAPKLGEQTDFILGDLGFDREAIADLHNKRVVKSQ